MTRGDHVLGIVYLELNDAEAHIECGLRHDGKFGPNQGIG